MHIDAIKALNTKLAWVPKREWPKIWWDVMCRKWPEELGERPVWVQDEALKHIGKRIQQSIGLKACYRYMNTSFNGMSDQMFDDWWDSSGKKELNKKCTRNTKNGTYSSAAQRYKPIMSALGACFFGFLGGLLGLVLLYLL